MVILNRNFPFENTDEAIRDTIKKYSDEIFNTRAKINTILQIYPLIQLGINELQSREITKMNRFSKRLAWISFCIGIVSLILAGAGIYASMINIKAGNIWENQHMQKLDQIIQKIDIVNNTLKDDKSRNARLPNLK